MSLSEIDLWVGKTLFIPSIIKLSKLTRQSQFAVSRLFWFIAALDAFYHADTPIASLVWGGASAFMMITAALRADDPAISLMFFRLLALAFVVLDGVRGANTGVWVGVEFWPLVLVAEYAATIGTSPPRGPSRRRSRRTSGDPS
jgi:hypothetical protein